MESMGQINRGGGWRIATNWYLWRAVDLEKAARIKSVARTESEG